MGSAVVEALARPVVESVERIVNFVLRDLSQIGGLGKVLAQQAIGVLVEPALPRVIRVCEVHIRPQAVSDECVLRKLFAIVKGDRLAQALLGRSSAITASVTPALWRESNCCAKV